MKKHALNQIKEKAIKKLDAKSQKRVQRQIMLFKQHLLEIKAKQEERKLAIETDVTNAINIAKTYQGDMATWRHGDMATYNIDEIKCDILNLKKTNELMLIKLIEFLQETGKLTSDDFPILLEKIKQIGEHLGPIGQELTTTVATRTKMGVAV